MEEDTINMASKSHVTVHPQEPARSRVIGIVGVGAMGRGIARNLARSDFEVLAYDVKANAVEVLKPHGVMQAKNLNEICKKCQLVFTCLPSIDAVEKIYLGTDGLVDNCSPGCILVDCTSSNPTLTRRIGNAAKHRNLSLVDAPMLMGSDVAWQGQSTLIVGGDPATIAACEPVFEAFSSRRIFSGKLGTAHELKAINNAVSLANHAVLSEAFAAAIALDLDLHALIEILSSSKANSAKLKDLAPVIRGAEGLNFLSFANSQKDLRNFQGVANDAGTQSEIAKAVLSYFLLADTEIREAETIERLPRLLVNLATQASASNNSETDL